MLRSGGFKMKKLLTLLFFSLFISSAFAKDCSSEAEKGMNSYQNGQYEQAIDFWKTCTDQGIEHPDLFYNLGNAYFRLGRLGFAIFYYESAHRLNPSDKDIIHNLKHAKSLTKDKVKEAEENPILASIYALHHLISLKGELLIVIGLIWLIAAILLFKVISKSPRNKNICIGAIFILSIFLGIITLSAGYKIFVLETETKGVVTATSADVTSAAHARSQTLNILSEGTVFKVLSIGNGWVEIQLGEKIKGFVKTTEVGIIDDLL